MDEREEQYFVTDWATKKAGKPITQKAYTMYK